MSREEEWAMEMLYWFYRMVVTGGPDGSELDRAVRLDADKAASWYERLIADEGGRRPEYDRPKYAPPGRSEDGI
jgi:hypothetical protein